MKKNFILFKCLVLLVSVLYTRQMYAQDTTSLGSISELEVTLTTIHGVKSRNSEKNNFKFSHNGVLQEIVLDKVVKDKSETTFMGHDRSNDSRAFFLSIMGDDVEGNFMDNSSDEVISFTSLGGEVIAFDQDINEVICVHYEYVQADVPKEKASRERLDDSPGWNKLQSLPGSSAVVYLDFDGEKVSNTQWNQTKLAGGKTIDAKKQNYTSADIKNIWKEVSEDFMPFTINVTTDRSVYNSAPQNSRMMCIFTSSWEWYLSRRIGGVAKLNSFDNNRNDPCWVFNYGVRIAAITASHEVGHTLGLSHDGRKASGSSTAETYYNGHNNWGTIMGGAKTRTIAQWSKGEYNRANNQQNDLAQIVTNKNVNYKEDDHSNARSGATNIIVETNGNILDAKNDGVIERNNDKDYFKFVTGEGQVKIEVKPASYATNLNVQCKLLDANGNQVDVSSPGNSFAGTMTNNLKAGTYYVEIDGVGDGSNATVGFTGYSSLGYYSISGKIITSVPKDCNGVSNGTAYLDYCNECVGGNTGGIPCQVPYSEMQIPGTIEIENYDHGGQNVSYFESDQENKGDFRLENPVDLGALPNSGYYFGWSEKGEWTEYTVDVQESGMYNLEYVVASPKSTAFFHLEMDNNAITESVNVVNTGDWKVWDTQEGETIELTAGKQVLKFEVDEAGLNLDKVIFRKSLVSAINTSIDESIVLYPNPNTKGIFKILSDVEWEVLNIQGVLVSKGYGNMVDLYDEQNGVYLVKINGTIQKIVLNK